MPISAGHSCSLSLGVATHIPVCTHQIASKGLSLRGTLCRGNPLTSAYSINGFAPSKEQRAGIGSTGANSQLRSILATPAAILWVQMQAIGSQ